MLTNRCSKSDTQLKGTVSSPHGRADLRSFQPAGALSRADSPLTGATGRGRSAGFTLVELVVVIVAIAILAALIVPTVQVSVESSRRMRCISNVRQLSTGVRLYAIDNYNHIPSLATWDTAIAPYLGLQSSDPNLQTKGVFRCPSGWLAGADTASDQRTYNYNFHSEPFTVNTNSVTQVYKSPALGEYLHPDQTLVITCWWFFRWSGNWTTPPSTTHPSGRPTGYLDGHVVVETAPPFYQNGSPPNAALVQY